MVHFTTVVESNAQFARDHKDMELVCVLAGATSGIGASTLETLVSLMPKSRFYVIGRSAARFTSQQTLLEYTTASCNVVFIEAEFSLLSHVDNVCEQIVARESRVDYLCMSPGMIPLNGAEYTKEGLETCFAISYYSRMRLLFNLLPLLRRSTSPRVLNILNAGKEKALADDDLGLERNWSALTVINHATTMTSLAFEHLAPKEEKMTLIHVYPGWVRTDNFSHLTAPEDSGLLWRSFLWFIRNLAGTLALLFGVSAKECGQRQAFHLISDRFGPGAWRLDHVSEEAPETSALKNYNAHSWPGRIWNYTISIFEQQSLRDKGVYSQDRA
ncbi:Oxidoreductase lepF [Cladobotryum mycophilum]|uniref:Oxidoreductase lepF n=1 Tax=Cladobotryum mycophilum TaxID=491253 RepID=A0ABR0SZL4_9HYPO